MKDGYARDRALTEASIVIRQTTGYDGLQRLTQFAVVAK